MIDLMSRPVIRSLTWKIGRRLYSFARRDVSNKPETNGEYWLLERHLNETKNALPILMDIGANKGDWSAKSIELLSRFNKNGIIYAFEPTQSTYTFLTKRFAANDCVKPNKIALSVLTGMADFFIVGELAGTNSLNKAEDTVVEKVETQTFDDFLMATGLESVLFVKSDTEGYDMNILMGAEKSLKKGGVEVWQFEYNHRWIASHHSLKDVFNFIEDKPYCLGKLYGNGIEIYREWHPELERYFEGNYVLIRNGSDIEKLGVFMHFDKSNVLVPT